MEHANREIEETGELSNGVILPSQYFGTMSNCALCSEQRLMLAVLADAINVLQDRDPLATASKRKAFAEAAEWVITRETR